MTELIACIIAYNEAELLPDCLESIIGKVDRIVVVDGRIAAFPGDGHLSTDGTVNIARKCGAEVILPTRPWHDEMEMRSQFLVGNEGDWYLIIDADERCMTPLPDINNLPDGIHAYSIMVKMILDGTGKHRPRLFRHQGKMEFKHVHDGLFSDGVLVSNPNTVPKLNSVWFGHYQDLRTKDRRARKHQYYKEGYKDEPEHRRRYAMQTNV
jgi:glycosyltransferase involved in cell wall biosynthesis